MARFSKKALEELKKKRDARRARRAKKQAPPKKAAKKPAQPKRRVRPDAPREYPTRDSEGRVVIELPEELYNGNTGQTKHWSDSAELRKDYAYALLAKYHKATPPDYKQHIVVTRVLGKRQQLWDADSVLRGSAKQLIDSLVDHGFLHDDGPKWLVTAIGKQDESRREDGPSIVVELYPA